MKSLFASFRLVRGTMASRCWQTESADACSGDRPGTTSLAAHSPVLSDTM